MAKKILVADDERHIVRLVQVNLERAGYEVVTAFDGKEALEKVELENPDLLVLDLMMPYLHGFDVLERLRKNPATRELPVIMLVAKAPDQDVFRGWQSDVDCYLTKPFNPMELISFVRRIFAARGESETDGEEVNPHLPQTAVDTRGGPQSPGEENGAEADTAVPKPLPNAAKPVSWWMKIRRPFS